VSRTFFTSAVLKLPLEAAKEGQSVHTPAFNTVHGAFVYVVQHNLMWPFHPEQPLAVVVDFAAMHRVGVSGAYAIQEWAKTPAPKASSSSSSTQMRSAPQVVTSSDECCACHMRNSSVTSSETVSN
jgi:hypothetical protein